MITYETLLAELNARSDESYRAFHKKLLKNESINVIGVRTPALRALAKEHKDDWRELISFPDTYYEVTFLKCAVAGKLPFETFCTVVDGLVPLLDNWATCDTFTAPCIAKHREEFLPYIERYLADGREFVHRFGLTTLLHDYVEERYLPLIFESVRACDGTQYYVSMAAAWLMAEVLVKHYDAGVRVLQEGSLVREIHNKAIQKARESYRLDAAQKAYLNTLKR